MSILLQIQRNRDDSVSTDGDEHAYDILRVNRYDADSGRSRRGVRYTILLTHTSCVISVELDVPLQLNQLSAVSFNMLAALRWDPGWEGGFDDPGVCDRQEFPPGCKESSENKVKLKDALQQSARYGPIFSESTVQ